MKPRPDLTREYRRRIAKLYGVSEEDVGQITITDTVADTPVVTPADRAHQATIPTATGMDIEGKSRRAGKTACKGVKRKEIG